MKSRNPWWWVPSLYTAEGIPYVIVMSVATIMYGRLGLTNAQIALYTSWLYLPWVIKPFWSPVVELFGSKHRWIVAMQFLIGTSMAGVAFFLPGSHFVQSTLAFFWLMAFSSATHDIAADGYYLLALDTRQQAFFVGIRSTFYRIASIFGQGLLVMLAGTLEARFQPVRAWMLTFIFISVVFLLFAFWHARMLPRQRSDVKRNVVSVLQVARDFLSTFVSFFRKPAVIPALLFMLLYRLPEALLVKICPLFMLDRPDHGGLGLTTGDLGMVQGTIGVVGLTLGGILGGIAAENGGLRRWLWPMVLAITLPDVVYIVLSYYQPENLIGISACVFVEQFGYGFGFTAYMLYLMLYARGANSTAHYSFCTGLMALGMMLPGLVAGYLQESVGYLNFFIIVTVLCLLTFLVAFLVPLDDEEEPAEVEEA